MYTGHKDNKMADGTELVDWIQFTMRDESRRYGVPMPTREQAALVISALRMHTVIERASLYDQSELGHPDEIAQFWPMESSIGRFFRDSAQKVLDEAQE